MNFLVRELKTLHVFKEPPRKILAGSTYHRKRHSIVFNDPIISSLKADINKLISLDENWDSYNAEAISARAIDLAVYVIEILALKNILIDIFSPLRDGGIQLEKSFPLNQIEIEIHPDNVINLLIYDNESNLINEIKYSTNMLDSLINKVNSFA